MKNFTLKSTAIFLFLACFSASALLANGQKMTAEEVVAKHLDSIGAKEKRATIKNTFLMTDVDLSVKGSATPVRGKAVILSSTNKNLWGMNLSSNDYPQERFAFDGKKVDVGFVKPGLRSVLGSFILTYKELLEESLLGGALTSSWVLSENNPKKGKISFDGTKKINDKETFVLGYTPKGGSDLEIRMYFDQKNFRHVRTEYNRIIAARQGTTVDSSAGQSSDRFRLVEDFSDFENLGGLMLPKTYKISYAYYGTASLQSAQNLNRELDWKLTVTGFSFNQDLAEDAFDINAK